MRTVATLLALSLAPAAIAQCTFEAPGTQVLPTPVDAWTTPRPIGFAFPFAGGTYTDVAITDHGVVALSNAGVPATPLGGSFVWNPSPAKLVQNGPVIAPYWSDHLTAAGGIYLESTATKCTITWLNHQTYLNQNPPFSVQLVLYATGQVDMKLDSRVNNSGSSFGALNAVVGMSPGTPAVLPAISDLSAGISTTDNSFFEEFVTFAPATPNPLFDLKDKILICTPTTPTGWTVRCEPLETIKAPGTQITPTPVDAWTAIQSLGFAFPFNGTTYSDIYITDHGMVALSNGGTPASPGNGGFTYTVTSASLAVGGPKIAAYWSDHNCNAPGAIYIDNTSGSYCTVTWLNAETYFNQRPPFTVQLTMYATGRVTICLEDRVTNNGSSFDLDAVIGMGNGAATPLPAASDLSAGVITPNPTCFEQWTTTAAGTPNPLFDVGDKVLTFLPTNPGWAVTVDTLDCASNATYGTGCNGLTLNSNQPILGRNWVLTTTGIDPISPIAITFFGAGRVDPGLPLTLIGINAPGCSVAITGLVGNLSGPNGGGTASVTIPVPLSASLKGGSLAAQSLCLTTANPGLMSTSNGLEGFLGY